MKNYDETPEEDHDAADCGCYACVLTRYWAAHPGILSPDAQERVEGRVGITVFIVGGPGAERAAERNTQRDNALLDVWGDVFSEIAESERIDRIIRYDQP